MPVVAMPYVEGWIANRCPTVFRVENITSGRNTKMVRIFNFPIAPGQTRDLLSIPGISEADIRCSLLKGELYIKLICKEIHVVESNIDLIQFDACQKSFLQNAGITEGLDATDTLSYLHRNNIRLIGPLNGTNKVFTIPVPDKFIEGVLDNNEFSIIVTHNGRKLVKYIDYLVSESVLGGGFDTIEIVSFVPDPKSKLIADYVIRKV
jgi:hypothetical protein